MKEATASNYTLTNTKKVINDTKQPSNSLGVKLLW